MQRRFLERDRVALRAVEGRPYPLDGRQVYDTGGGSAPCMLYLVWFFGRSARGRLLRRGGGDDVR